MPGNFLVCIKFAIFLGNEQKSNISLSTARLAYFHKISQNSLHTKKFPRIQIQLQINEMASIVVLCWDKSTRIRRMITGRGCTT